MEKNKGLKEDYTRQKRMMKCQPTGLNVQKPESRDAPMAVVQRSLPREKSELEERIVRTQADFGLKRIGIMSTAL